MSEWRGWWAEQPPVTKWLGALSLAVPLAGTLYPPLLSLAVWHLPSILRGQLWRPLTAPFVARVDFGLLIAAYMRVRYTALLEADPAFAGRPADLVVMLLAVLAAMCAANTYLARASLWDGLTLAAVHVWAQLNRDVPVTFMFGIRFRARYLSAALAAISFVTGGGDIAGPAMGILAGHVYYVAAFVRGPLGPRLFAAPAWMVRLFGAPKTSPPPTREKDAAPDRFRAFGGTGKRLGKD